MAQTLSFLWPASEPKLGADVLRGLFGAGDLLFRLTTPNKDRWKWKLKLGDKVFERETVGTEWWSTPIPSEEGEKGLHCVLTVEPIKPEAKPAAAIPLM